MKRRNFFKNVGIGLAAATLPSAIVNAGVKQNTMEEFIHNPADYAQVPEETEEFQEYEIDIPEDWAEEDIVLT